MLRMFSMGNSCCTQSENDTIDLIGPNEESDVQQPAINSNKETTDRVWNYLSDNRPKNRAWLAYSKGYNRYYLCRKDDSIIILDIVEDIKCTAKITKCSDEEFTLAGCFVMPNDAPFYRKAAPRKISLRFAFESKEAQARNYKRIGWITKVELSENARVIDWLGLYIGN